ncbi:hypothetical protein IC757_12940 [Wenzhouxiangella sp. AB-CW3]|uniref:hypothetical protein n=1 Tax=Wenzhouxiangella sp. AB-CW3 TaxID=2771012 RepID=UPI00168ACC4C|nr:hypothetical protein [Wenzhouxiangella sp. AB-CW3]QOC21927.1 hypothetical protein IC757_12940 [Wenzhouxiangella sp. AB-CW3]
MNQALHHIRLAAGLEIQSDPASVKRVLAREPASELAAHLARDLARVVPEVEQTMLVAGGALFEPTELLQPGLPAWTALEELAGNLLRQSGFQPQVLAIGAHEGRLPHRDLQPGADAPLGQFLVIPLVLLGPTDQATSIEQRLEASLFETGAVHPPGRALLQTQLGLDTVHGQLLTANDLIALQHVQLDGAGLGGFWPVIEHALMAPDQPRTFELPGALSANWNAHAKRLDVQFLGHDQALARQLDPVLWTRAFRTMIALLDAHAVDWQAIGENPLTFDSARQMMIEAAGSASHADGLTVHHHPQLGLLAWTVVEDGNMHHLHPLRPSAAEAIEQELSTRHGQRAVHCRSPQTDPMSGCLQPATDPR